MMRTLHQRWISWALNLLVIGAVSWAGYSWLLARPRHATRRPERLLAPLIADGIRLDVPMLSLKPGVRTVLLVVSTSCPYCARGTPFYRTLRSAANGGTGRETVVLCPVEDRRLLGAKTLAEQWLDAEAIRADRIVYLDPRILGIPATPTIVVIDGAASVSAVWIGVLTGEDEASVRRCAEGLTWDRNTPAQQSYRFQRYSRTTVRARGANVTLLDTRPRNAVDSGNPAADGRRIPVDELPVRAPIELDRSREVVVNCLPQGVGDCWQAARSLKTTGYSVGLLDR